MIDSEESKNSDATPRIKKRSHFISVITMTFGRNYERKGEKNKRKKEKKGS